ncbi:MAG TPA: hypothetical protein VF510_06800, partial [Ktedonobacterales bacterium]
ATQGDRAVAPIYEDKATRAPQHDTTDTMRPAPLPPIPTKTPPVRVVRATSPQSSPTLRRPILHTCETCASFRAPSATRFYCTHDATTKKREADGYTPACPAWERA